MGTQNSVRTALKNKSNPFASNKPLKHALEHHDVVLYQAPSGVKQKFTWLYISAGVQLIFWGNLASLAYVAYSVKDGEEEDAPIVLGPKGERIAIAGGLVAVGVGIASLMCIYPWR
ncbi:uncharacterized protein BX663DRAFT_503383 [Cokeromyces recurvatus]|uniref:uncharacterized protein n=1 Tax=Cokeromyces recurvatus TaxID=90255 RepID=UPI002220E109|nr:uncharacterized protein BX663DRAFT_503383 [Cokeromyces recurvatus]KAI7904739.1 hypothetical protein BX663DRAFT_503383 [Cokeromyces recurvatus]